MTDDVDRKRRHFLTVATAVTGIAGIGVASIPFLASLKPSARAQALGAPVPEHRVLADAGRAGEDDDERLC